MGLLGFEIDSGDCYYYWLWKREIDNDDLVGGVYFLPPLFYF